MHLELNIGSGKVPFDKTELPDSHFLVNVDCSYSVKSCSSIAEIENHLMKAVSNVKPFTEGFVFFCSSKAVDFLDSFRFKVDKITCSRYMEHVPLKDLISFIYLLHNSCKKDGILEILVPDHRYYAETLIGLDKVLPVGEINKDFLNRLLEITTEFCNEPYDPHGSIWTENLAKYYLEFEGYWQIKEITSVGRNSTYLDYRPYLKIIASRP